MVESCRVKFLPCSKMCTSSSARWYTPFSRLPMPIGQVSGAQAMPSTDSTSSSSSIGERPSRSSLLMKVMIGVSRSRQTSISLIVRSSTPLAQSITISAESTAVSTR